jgi:amino acid transporter
MRQNEEIDCDLRSISSDSSNLCLDEEDRHYLQALKDRDYVVTKNTRHPLGLFSVIAFIVQQVIGEYSQFTFQCMALIEDQGTGIFRTPWTAIHATQSVGITLLFWLFGALTALAGMALYIEFGLSIPRHAIDGKKEPVVRNGGDLNYVSHAFPNLSFADVHKVHYLIKRPRFLVLSCYAVNYIFLASSAANALSFGDDIVGGEGADRGALRDAAARGLAILAVTLPCFLHAFTRRGGILINNIFVVFKIAILCVFPVMAICVLAGVVDSNHAAQNLSSQNSFANARSDVDSYTQGILAVMYAYSGYNQANYVCYQQSLPLGDLQLTVKVLCEIEKPRKNFTRGIIIAMTIVCILYMLVNLSYVSVVAPHPYRLESG